MPRIDRRAAAVDRDRGLQRLRRWTVGCAIGAAGLVGLVAVLAAGTFPGRGIVDAATSAGTSPDDQPPESSGTSSAVPAQSGSGQLGAPSSGFFGGGGGGGAPSAASGGS